MSSEKIVDRVAKLLAKAEATANPHEAEALAAKAEALMMQHAIDAALLNKRAAKNDRDEIVTRRYHLYGRDWNKQQMRLAHALSRGLGTTEMLRSSRGAWDEYVHMYGYASDLDAFEILFESLKAQQYAAMLFWWKNEGGLETFRDLSAYQRKNQKRGFMEAYAQRVGERLREQRETQTSERDKQRKVKAGSTALVLTSRHDEVKAFTERMNPRTGSSRMKSNGALSSREAGRRAGDRADVGNARIAATSKALTS